MRISTERQHRRMFQQKQRVADKILLPRSDHLLLDSHAFHIRDATEMDKIDVHDRFVRALAL